MIATDVDRLGLGLHADPLSQHSLRPTSLESHSANRLSAATLQATQSQSLHPACGSLPLDLTDLSCQPVSSSPDPLLYTPPLYVPASSAFSTFQSRLVRSDLPYLRTEQCSI